MRNFINAIGIRNITGDRQDRTDAAGIVALRKLSLALELFAGEQRASHQRASQRGPSHMQGRPSALCALLKRASRLVLASGVPNVGVTRVGVAPVGVTAARAIETMVSIATPRAAWRSERHSMSLVSASS